MVRLHTENQLDTLPGSASKVCVVVVGGWVVESKLSDWLQLKPNKMYTIPYNIWSPLNYIF